MAGMGLRLWGSRWLRAVRRFRLEQVVALLAMGEPLPEKNRDHDCPAIG